MEVKLNKYQSIPEVESSFLLKKEDTDANSSPESELFVTGRLSVARKTAAFVGLCCFLLALVVGWSEPAYTAVSSLPFFRASASSGANTIELCAWEMIKTKKQKSQNAHVKCYDKDPLSEDDLMAEGHTGTDGCVRLKYADICWDCPAATGFDPDIYCIVQKNSFVSATPPDKDHHDPSQLAKFEDVTLYRDRLGDYGDTNGCGPAWSEIIGINYIAEWATRFGPQCANHDKCYWDCQIYLGFNDPAKAQEFCDFEMYMGMRSFCYANRGKLPGGGDSGCLLRAEAIYRSLQGLGAIMAYDKNNENCPEDGKSMNNDYSHRNCHGNGYKCGYNGSFDDDYSGCHQCCNAGRAISEGAQWDDHYCVCFPGGVKCGTTLAGVSFDKCGQCCHGRRTDGGFLYRDFFCT